jgi:hypothetical protein
MDSVLTQFFADLAERLHGPFSFRFVVQPSMALLYAIRDGLGDARAGRPPYFWTMFTRPDERPRLLREGWKAMTRVLLFGVVIDVLYQLMVFGWVHPVQLVVVVLGLAFVPYVLMRGPVTRIAGMRHPTSSDTRPRPLAPDADEAARRRDVRT